MVCESKEEKFSLGGKCEQHPWLALKMPVARQAKHETCVRGMAIVLSSHWLALTSNSEYGTSTAVAGFSQGRRPGEPPSTVTEFARSLKTRIFHKTPPRTQNKNRISHDIESELPLTYHVVLSRSCRLRPSDIRDAHSPELVSYCGRLFTFPDATR